MRTLRRFGLRGRAVRAAAKMASLPELKANGCSFHSPAATIRAGARHQFFVTADTLARGARARIFRAFISPAVYFYESLRPCR